MIGAKIALTRINSSIANVTVMWYCIEEERGRGMVENVANSTVVFRLYHFTTHTRQYGRIRSMWMPTLRSNRAFRVMKSILLGIPCITPHTYAPLRLRQLKLIPTYCWSNLLYIYECTLWFYHSMDTPTHFACVCVCVFLCFTLICQKWTSSHI